MTKPKGLRLADDLVLPLDFATEGVGIVGMRGSGKSSTEVRWAEVCYEAGIPFVAVDPKGDWWGIRSSGDGKGPGLSVPVFGGLHGDFPLEPHMGAQIADLLVDHMLSAVLDVSRLSQAGRTTFLVAFFNRLMERHQREPHVRSVILEEAHRIIPQDVRGETAKLKEAGSAILLEGRAWGLGCWAPTQRPARLHKDVMEEVGNLILFRLPITARNDKKAVADWFKHHDMGDEIVASLDGLRPGQGWFVSASHGDPRMVQMHRRQTFDSGATPTVGASLRPPSRLADIDATAITAALAEQIEKAKADDPRELRKQVAALRREIDQARREWAAEVEALHRQIDETPPLTVEVPVFDEELLVRLEEALTPAVGLMGELQELLRTGVEEGENGGLTFTRTMREDLPRAGQARDRAGGGEAKRPPATHTPVNQTAAARRRAALAVAPERPDPPPARREPGRAADAGAAGDVKLGKAERLILTALAQYPEGRRRQQVAFMAGYSADGGGFKNALSTLRTRELIEGTDPLVATAAGIEALGDDWEPLPTGRALAEYWMGHKLLGHAEREVLRVLLDVWPDGLGRVDLAGRTNSAKGGPYEPDGGGFKNALSKLRTLELITGSTELCVSDDLIGD